MTTLRDRALLLVNGYFSDWLSSIIGKERRGSYERPRSHRTAVAPATKPNSTATAMAPAKWTFIVTIDAQLRCEVPVFDNGWLSGAFGQVPHGCPFLSTFAVTLAGSAVKSQASTNITEPIQSG